MSSVSVLQSAQVGHQDIFLRMPLWSSKKLGSGFIFISLTLPLQSWLCFCFLFQHLQIKLFHSIGGFLWGCVYTVDFFNDVFNNVINCGWNILVVIFPVQTQCSEPGYGVCNHISLTLNMLELDSYCCSSRVHLSSTELDMIAVKNRASGL